MPNFTPIGATWRGEKPQNRPLSKLNTGRFALHAMLPVTKVKTLFGYCDQIGQHFFAVIDIGKLVSLALT